MDKFWIVTRKPSEVAFNNPVNAVYSLEEAVERAEALCKKTGFNFYVLEAIEFCQPSSPPIEWKTLSFGKSTKFGCADGNCGCGSSIGQTLEPLRPRDSYGRFTKTPEIDEDSDEEYWDSVQDWGY